MFRLRLVFSLMSLFGSCFFLSSRFFSAQHRLGRTIKQNYLLSCLAKLIRVVLLLIVPYFLTVPHPKPCNISRA